MTALNLELLPLIHRHLKEHGFLTAADELQKKLSPQDGASTSATLMDIYTAWLKSSKRRKKPATPRNPTPNRKQSTPNKGAEKKKTNKTNKQSGSPNKKATPAKRKKDGGKNTDKVVKPSKSDSLNKEAAGGEDSDSSLDEEKWKKLVREMTDADLVKVEAFNALVAPETKKQRVRKPRAKPNPKTETPTNGQGPQNAKLDKLTDEVLAESLPTKKSRTKKAAPVAALNCSNKDQHVEIPDASLILTSKRSPKKEKRKASDPASLEPKSKKKKVTIENNVITSGKDGDGQVDKNIDNMGAERLSPKAKSPENTPNLQPEPKKKKKKRTSENVTENVSGDGIIGKNINDSMKMVSPAQTEFNEGNPESAVTLPTEAKKKKKKKANEETTDGNMLVISAPVNTAEDLNGNLPPEDLTGSLNTADSDSVVKVKKKKKKKDKEKDDRESELAVESNTNSVICGDAFEKTTEESSPNAAEIIPKKKKKKKDKNKEESETLPQMETKAVDEAVHAEENTEEVVVKKKSKKKKKQSEEQLGTEDKTLSTEGCEIPEEPPDPPSTPQTPGSKKKKKKLISEELIEADAAQPPLESETPKKKKKTSSKSKESES